MIAQMKPGIFASSPDLIQDTSSRFIPWRKIGFFQVSLQLGKSNLQQKNFSVNQIQINEVKPGKNKDKKKFTTGVSK